MDTLGFLFGDVALLSSSPGMWLTGEEKVGYSR